MLEGHLSVVQDDGAYRDVLSCSQRVLNTAHRSQWRYSVCRAIGRRWSAVSWWIFW